MVIVCALEAGIVFSRCYRVWYVVIVCALEAGIVFSRVL